MQTSRVLPLVLGVLAAGCASRPLPKYETPLAPAQVQSVRTTAYTHTESDHRKYRNHNAIGGQLQSGEIRSAACDWSRWPVGTVFRVRETGETFVVDDYGWALAGRNTIDLYKPTRTEMNQWGVRRVTIEILEWGDVNRSLTILRPRGKYAHVRRMVTDLRRRYDELKHPFDDLTPPAAVAVAAPVKPPAPASASAAPVALNEPPTTRPRTGGFSPARPALMPFSESR